jgi:uncharacterized protein YecT (DUF1311 family)
VSEIHGGTIGFNSSMKLPTPILALGLLLTRTTLAAGGTEEASAKKHRIDVVMEAAMEKDPSTAGMVRAISDANTAWDREMNAAYQALKAKLEPELWKALVQAQKAWLAYRDAQIASLNAFYAKMEGTMWIPVSASKVMEITKERALLLDSLRDDLAER